MREGRREGSAVRISCPEYAEKICKNMSLPTYGSHRARYVPCGENWRHLVFGLGSVTFTVLLQTSITCTLYTERGGEVEEDWGGGGGRGKGGMEGGSKTETEREREGEEHKRIGINNKDKRRKEG